jgi:pilus assembly protein Flp/PilA
LPAGLHQPFILFLGRMLAFPTVLFARPAEAWAEGMSMRGFRNVVADFLADDCGATGTEYALIATGIAIAIIASMSAIATSINQTFGNVTTTFN